MSSSGIEQQTSRRWSGWIVHEGGKLRAGRPGDLIDISFVRLAPQGLIWFRDQFFLEEFHFDLSWADTRDCAIVAYRFQKPCVRSLDAIRCLREIARDPEGFAAVHKRRVIRPDVNGEKERIPILKSFTRKGPS